MPAENEKFTCRLHPGLGVLKTVHSWAMEQSIQKRATGSRKFLNQGKSVQVHVVVTLHMTTNVERKIKFEVEGLGMHLFTIRLVGELSHKLDPDDIVTKPPAIGMVPLMCLAPGVHKQLRAPPASS